MNLPCRSTTLETVDELQEWFEITEDMKEALQEWPFDENE
jgi:hypothetical protein